MTQGYGERIENKEWFSDEWVQLELGVWPSWGTDRFAIILSPTQGVKCSTPTAVAISPMPGNLLRKDLTSLSPFYPLISFSLSLLFTKKVLPALKAG